MGAGCFGREREGLRGADAPSDGDGDRRRGLRQGGNTPRWEPLLLLVQAPADAGSALLRFELGAGATVDLFALALV